QTGEKKVTVAVGSSQIVKFDLNQEAAGDQGMLKVVSMVPEAQVFIDGAALGKVPQEKKVSAGEHPVVVRLEGYKQFEQKVRVEAGQKVTISADLKAVGRLRVLTTPSKANVMINGLPGGQTPLPELGIGARAMLADAEPFSAGVFSELWWGSKLLDNSSRNGLTWNVGGAVSLTAIGNVTISGRGYLNVWDDRHCPAQGADPTMNDG